MKFAVCAPLTPDPSRTLAVISSHRAKYIECGPQMFLQQDIDWCRRLKDLLKSTNVQLNSVHLPFREGYDLSVIDNTSQEFRHLEDILYKGATAGAKVFILHPGGPCRTSEIDRRLKTAAANLQTLSKNAEELNVQIAVENLPPGYLGAESQHILQLFEEVDSEKLGVCFDTGHAHLCNNFAGQLRELSDQIIHFHIHDNNGKGDQHLPPPYGTIDWTAFYAVFSELGFTRPLTLECSPWGDELPPEGHGLESDYSILLDQSREFFQHLRKRHELQRAQTLRTFTPHAGEMQL